MARNDALPSSLPPRGVNRVMAAQYVGVSVGTFDRMVAEGLMPHPKRVGERKIWDVRGLDMAFDSLPGEGERNSWDDLP